MPAASHGAVQMRLLPSPGKDSKHRDEKKDKKKDKGKGKGKQSKHKDDDEGTGGKNACGDCGGGLT